MGLYDIAMSVAFFIVIVFIVELVLYFWRN